MYMCHHTTHIQCITLVSDLNMCHMKHVEESRSANYRETLINYPHNTTLPHPTKESITGADYVYPYPSTCISYFRIEVGTEYGKKL